MSVKSDPRIQAGFAQSLITPAVPLPLAGIGGTRLGTGVLDDLYAKALVLRQGDRTAGLVSLDLLWVSRTFCDAIRERAGRELSMDGPDLMIAATHTHGGPQTRENTFDGCPVDSGYLSFLADKVIEVLRAAKDDLSECSVEYGEGRTSISINRRRSTVDLGALKKFQWQRRMANRPNPDGPCDDAVGVLWFRPVSGGLETVVVNAACHPSLWRGESCSADFPGRLEGLILGRNRKPARVLFLQGFGGDLRDCRQCRAPFKIYPPGALASFLFDRVQFQKESTEQDLCAVARQLAGDVQNTPCVPAGELTIESGASEAALPMDNVPPIEYFHSLAGARDPETAAYGAYVHAHYADSLPVRVQTLSLSPEIVLVGVEGEVFCEYALWLRGEYGGRGLVLPVGCCGGMAGYLPDAASLAQGGYEVERSLVMFGLPGGFAPGIETALKDAMREAIP